LDRSQGQRKTRGTLFSDINDWEDTNAYRLGLTYDILPDTTLRCGYAFHAFRRDGTGQEPL